MQFSTLFFVAAFLPVFIFIYGIAPDVKGKNIVLLLFSLLFYAFSGVPGLVLLLLMTFLGFLSARIIAKIYDAAGLYEHSFAAIDEEFEAPALTERKKSATKKANIVLIATVAIDLIVLGIFKYAGFFMELFKASAGNTVTVPSLFLPLGISFYLFKLISYVADVKNGKCQAADFFHVLLYTVNFHEIAQGPITRYPAMEKALDDRQQTTVLFSEGMWRFTVGLFKKTILADHSGKLAESFLPVILEGHTMTKGGVLFGSLFYMLQLYLDFSAYSDMALGLGRMCGFIYPENFNYPYLAGSVRDFWRRWHISLSSFFRDYVYIPLGGNRVPFYRQILNLLVVWALTGLWHGGSLNFILWGLYYFAFIVLENVSRRRNQNKKQSIASLPVRILGHIYTLLVVYLGWILFRFTDFHTLGTVLACLFGPMKEAFLSAQERLTLFNNLYFLLVSILACFPIGHGIMQSMETGVRQSFRSEKREKDMLDHEMRMYAGERSMHDQYVNQALSDVEADDYAAREQVSHEHAVKRLEGRLRIRTRERGRREWTFYILRALLGLVLLFLSVLSMAGQSYMPFLYNQF